MVYSIVNRQNRLWLSIMGCFVFEEKIQPKLYFISFLFSYSADELLLTEMMFNGVFNSLQAEQAVALMSCFVFEEKTKAQPRLTEELAGPLRQMQV